jgi:hypothetical protein
MNTYSMVRNTGFATILVASLAGIVTNVLTLDQRVIYERELPNAASVVVLPEIVVIATRLET